MKVSCCLLTISSVTESAILGASPRQRFFLAETRKWQLVMLLMPNTKNLCSQKPRPPPPAQKEEGGGEYLRGGGSSLEGGRGLLWKGGGVFCKGEGSGGRVAERPGK